MSKWRLVRNAGVTCFTIPTIAICIMIYAAFREPRLILDHWDFYLLWLGLPYLIGAALLWWTFRHGPGDKPK